MSDVQLKAWFQQDLERLKTMDLGIVPAKKYYRDIFYRCFLIYLLFVGIQLASCFLAVQMHILRYGDSHLFKEMIAGVIFSSLFFQLFFVGMVKNYVLFTHQLKPQLQTGPYLAKKIRLALKLYFVIFGIFALIAIPLFEQNLTFFAGVLAFMLAAFIAAMVINMEVSRLGISVLSCAITRYFSEENKEARSHSI